jgi:hypothetical protein
MNSNRETTATMRFHIIYLLKLVAKARIQTSADKKRNHHRDKNQITHNGSTIALHDAAG